MPTDRRRRRIASPFDSAPVSASDRHAVEANAAKIRRLQLVDAAQQRALAGPAWADDADSLALMNVEADIMQNGSTSHERFRQSFHAGSARENRSFRDLDGRRWSTLPRWPGAPDASRRTLDLPHQRNDRGCQRPVQDRDHRVGLDRPEGLAHHDLRRHRHFGRGNDREGPPKSLMIPMI